MLTKEEAEQRVTRGAAYLDHVHPGWHNHIDVGRLKLHDGCGCILGQLCGDYTIGIMALGLVTEAVPRGFSLRCDDLSPRMSRPANYQPLQDAWVAAIAARVVAHDQQTFESAVAR